MFGPDKCGYTKRTHLIFNYKGKNVLKKADLDYKQEGEGTSHLYRMTLKPDNTVLVEIDEEISTKALSKRIGRFSSLKRLMTLRIRSHRTGLRTL